MQALSQVRPDAVALVDAFGFDDYQLNSTIGRCDTGMSKATTCRVKPLQLLTLASTMHLLVQWLLIIVTSGCLPFSATRYQMQRSMCQALCLRPCTVRSVTPHATVSA